MAHYVVGDIHGCLQPLQKLLAKVEFNPRYDQLWAVGDLIGRGPNAQATLEFLADLGPALQTVLGNHDLHALAVLCELRQPNPKDNTASLLHSESRDFWIEWLRKQPLLLADAAQSLLITHAGIHPQWSVDEAAGHAQEVELVLRSNNFVQFLEQMYGNHPVLWHEDLAGVERWRFIVNVFTRMRYLEKQSLALDLTEKSPPTELPASSALMPWFAAWPQSHWRIAFGHWASLMGQSSRSDVIALDTGCVWGESLTLLDVEGNKKISVPGWQR